MKSKLLNALLIITTILIGSNNSVKSQSISGGGDFTLSLCNDGTLNSWGKNEDGQLGNGTTTTSNAPSQVNGINEATYISAGLIHSLALKKDGTVWGWGSNSEGQLGLGNFSTNYNLPIQITGLSNVTKISAGNYHSLFLKNDGTVWGCGYSFNGEIGTGSSSGNVYSPVKMGLGSTFTNVIAISAGGNHSLMLKSDGTVWGCGFDSTGVLGQGGTTNTNKYYPVQMLGVTGAIAIAAGGHHSLILKSDGTVWTCGDNYNGELGNGNNINNNTATPVSGLTGIIAIAAGNYHSIALKNDGTVYTWGSNSGGQLGLGNDVDSNIPVQISGISGATSIEAGLGHSFIQKNDGTVWGSGYNYQGQLGIGNFTNSSTFQQTINLCNTLSTNEKLIEKLISIYPNPVKSNLTIQNQENFPIDKITITDITGKKVLEQKPISNTINVEKLPKGMYLLQTTSNNENSVTKFIKN